MTTNSAELKPFPCPFCGKASDLEDHDTLYPTGTYWRDDKEIGMRTYHGWRDRKDGDTTCWRMHCPVPSGGCGAEIGADSKDEAIAAWNRRTAAQGEQSKCKCTGNGYFIKNGKAYDCACQSGSAEQVSERDDRAFYKAWDAYYQHAQYKDDFLAFEYAWKAALSAPERKVTDDFDGLIRWLLGENGDFPLREDGDGAYWWRKELRERYQSLLNQQGEQTAPEGGSK